MAAYGAAKGRLMSWPGLRIAVINADDAFGRSLIDASHDKGRKIMSYGFGSADVCGTGLKCDAQGISFAVRTPWGAGEVTSTLVGEFNASNLLAVLSVLLASGVDLDSALDFLRGVRAPAGRMQRLGGTDDMPLVVIDYAHTPDALEKVLTALRPVVGKERELVCVFGCGGDRDAGKRPQMGGIAGRLADRVIVTDDNPRTEDPVVIADAIVAGIRGSGNPRYAVILDRSDAIAHAVKEARPGDVVLLAGKGHETYQERHGERQPFSDDEHAARALAERTAS
jgi:UDP-N-acetylmuramoyl-L-alanyl-D-glutamate--2,6-diaminopimelate ligase